MHIKFATLRSALRHVLDRIVEAAGDILCNVIFQVVAFVNHTLILMIVVTVISCAIDHMRDSNVLKHFCIFRDEVTAKVQEVIDDL